MSTPLWVHELAAAFWELAGDEPFPRDLRGSIVRALPVSVVTMEGLNVHAIDTWLARQGVICALGGGNRALRACLVAQRGSGLIFVDGADPADEQRFSLAHELAHFLRDYWWPRRRAAERFGPEVLEVFDGRRAPRPGERIHALLALLPVGPHVHLMERDPGGLVDEAVLRAEQAADRLAYELLAPEVAVRDSLFAVRGAVAGRNNSRIAERGSRDTTQRDAGVAGGPYGAGRGSRERAAAGSEDRVAQSEPRTAKCEQQLTSHYGLPAEAATRYAAIIEANLYGTTPRPSPLLQHLRMAVRRSPFAVRGAPMDKPLANTEDRTANSD